MIDPRYPHLAQPLALAIQEGAADVLLTPLNDGSGIYMAIIDSMDDCGEDTWLVRFTLTVNKNTYTLASGTHHIDVYDVSDAADMLVKVLSPLQDVRREAVTILRQGARDARDPAFPSLTEADAESCEAAYKACAQLYIEDDRKRLKGAIAEAAHSLVTSHSFPARIPLIGELALRIERCASRTGYLAVFLENPSGDIRGKLGAFPMDGDHAHYVTNITLFVDEAPEHGDAWSRNLLKRREKFQEEAQELLAAAECCQRSSRDAESLAAIYEGWKKKEELNS